MINLLPDSKWSLAMAGHLASRCISGVTRDDIARIFDIGREQGVAAAVASLVDADEDWDDFPFPEWWDNFEIVNGSPTGSPNGAEDEFAQWYFEQLASADPLGAKMFKFFVDHAPVSTALFLQRNRYIYLFQHFDLCRRQSLGNFKSFIQALSWDPAMMWMLDMRNSVRGSVNENFGRELLELFTMGEGRGYTEDDVVAASRAFTGRQTGVADADYPYPSFSNRSIWAPRPDQYLFIDTDEKTFLGTTLTAFGPNEPDPRTDHGDEVIDLVFSDPACSRHLVWKLWRYFVSPEPPAELVEQFAERFRTIHQYEIKGLLTDLFTSSAFYDEAYLGNSVKDAGDFAVSLIKALGVETPSPRLSFLLLESLGYDPIRPPNIAGWPEPEGEGNAWLGASRLLQRINLPVLWTQQSFAIFLQDNPLTRRNLANEVAPQDFKVENMIPLQGRDSNDPRRLLQSLNDRFLPLHPLDEERLDFILLMIERDYRHLNQDTLIRELVRVFVALPEFQLQ